MTKRFDKDNIIDYLHNFNKNCLRETIHSNLRHKERIVLYEETEKFLFEKKPIIIDQQDSKKFALIYEYDDTYNIKIVIALKDIIY